MAHVRHAVAQTGFASTNIKTLSKCIADSVTTFVSITDEMKHDGVWPVFKQENAFEHKPTASDFENIIKLKPSSNMSTYIEAKQIELINAELDGDTVVILSIILSKRLLGIKE